MEKKKLMKIFLGVVVVLGIGLLTWRLWSHSFNDVLSINNDEITKISCDMMISDVKEGSIHVNQYQLNSLTIEDEDFKQLIKFMTSTDYRSDFCNFFPSATTSFDTDGRNVFLTLETKNKKYVLYVSHNTFAINTDNSYLIYHPTNQNMINQLINYIQEHGTTNQ